MAPCAHAAADVDGSTCTNNSAPPAAGTDKLSSGIEVACPSCGHQFRHHHREEKQESMRLLPGLPAGVRFDPNDEELLEHLEGKTRSDGEGRSHPLIDEFIPTLQGENGICCTHPEKLPGWHLYFWVALIPFVIVQSLTIQGLGPSLGSSTSSLIEGSNARLVSLSAIKESSRNFHQKQSQWTVPDPELRESLRLYSRNLIA